MKRDTKLMLGSVAVCSLSILCGFSSSFVGAAELIPLDTQIETVQSNSEPTEAVIPPDLNMQDDVFPKNMELNNFDETESVEEIIINEQQDIESKIEPDFTEETSVIEDDSTVLYEKSSQITEDTPADEKKENEQIKIEKVENPYGVSTDTWKTKKRPEQLLQQDSRWADVPYGNADCAHNGCGITSIAMAVRTLTDYKDITPGDLCIEHGDEPRNICGTDSATFFDVGAKYGMDVREIRNPKIVAEEIRNNGALAISRQVGYLGSILTGGGHYVLIVDVDENNVCTVNDPNVYVGAAQAELKWNYDGKDDRYNIQLSDECGIYPWIKIAQSSDGFYVCYKKGTAPTQESLNERSNSVDHIIRGPHT